VGEPRVVPPVDNDDDDELVLSAGAAVERSRLELLKGWQRLRQASRFLGEARIVEPVGQLVRQQQPSLDEELARCIFGE
jgi:hypothetical protein